MADDAQSFLQEIDDSLRVEKLEQFWQRSGKMVLAVCVGIVLCTIANVMWKNHLHSEHVKQTSLLLRAEALAVMGKTTDAAALLEQAEKGSGSLAQFAKLRHGEILSDAGDTAKALTLYSQVADDHSLGSEDGLRSLARMHADVIVSNQAKGGALESKPSSAFGGIPTELNALNLMKAGKNKKAREALGTLIQNDALPKSERLRALELMDTIPPEDKK